MAHEMNNRIQKYAQSKFGNEIDMEDIDDVLQSIQDLWGIDLNRMTDPSED